MQQLGELAVGRSAPKGAPNLHRHQRNTAGLDDVAGGVTPTIERDVGYRRLGAAGPRMGVAAG
jgi:hypothetical protein